LDITELIRVGRDDARSHSLPLIVMERRGTASARSALTAHATDVGRTLRAPNGGTLTQSKDSTGGLWQSLFKGWHADRVSKLWLDGKAEAPDDESNTTVGAPSAWKSGWVGAGRGGGGDHAGHRRDNGRADRHAALDRVGHSSLASVPWESWTAGPAKGERGSVPPLCIREQSVVQSGIAAGSELDQKHGAPGATSFLRVAHGPATHPL